METFKSNLKQSLQFYTWLGDVKNGGSVISEDSFAAQFTYIDEFVNGLSDWILGPALFKDITKVPEQLRAKWNEHKGTLVQELIGTGFDPTKYENVDEMLEAFKEFIKKSEQPTPTPTQQPVNPSDADTKTFLTTTGISDEDYNKIIQSWKFSNLDKENKTAIVTCIKNPAGAQSDSNYVGRTYKIANVNGTWVWDGTNSPFKP